MRSGRRGLVVGKEADLSGRGRLATYQASHCIPGIARLHFRRVEASEAKGDSWRNGTTSAGAASPGAPGSPARILLDILRVIPSSRTRARRRQPTFLLISLAHLARRPTLPSEAMFARQSLSVARQAAARRTVALPKARAFHVDSAFASLLAVLIATLHSDEELR